VVPVNRLRRNELFGSPADEHIAQGLVGVGVYRVGELRQVTDLMLVITGHQIVTS
jgi:hypothetical protein